MVWTVSIRLGLGRSIGLSFTVLKLEIGRVRRGVHEGKSNLKGYRFYEPIFLIDLMSGASLPFPLYKPWELL